MKPIIVLICDTLPPAVVSAHGAYDVLFTTLFRASASALGLSPDTITIQAFDVVEKMEYPNKEDLDACAGVLLTGSKASAYEDIEWINKLVQFTASLASDRPTLKIVGICFGHQIIGRALAGRVIKNDGKWEVGPTPLQLTPLGKQVFGSEELNIQEMHQDIVPEVPPQFHLLGSTNVAANQGMVRFVGGGAPPSPLSLADIHILTVQGHPEFTAPIISILADLRGKAGILTPELLEDVARRSQWRNDGATVAGTTILKMLGVMKDR
ncbi:Glutamine amidotransferase type-1 domain-containing protein [Mycena kentingensis (nom. inval.)]|nr:Glutamine amidotransferase type-1 domain-containing protein [Mycena kentingensis (nom. inval.)]